MSGAQQAPPPPRGMQRIPFPLESYEHYSPPLSAKRLLNYFAEKQPADSRSEWALIPTPGLAEYLTLGDGPIRAINSDFPGFIYVVSGSDFYRLAFQADGSVITTNLGTIGDAAGPLDYLLFISIAVGPTGAVVCVPPNAWTCTHSDPANQLGGTFPGDAASVSYFDGYFVFTQQANNQQFFISRLLDPLDYDALDFASSTEQFPNATTRVLTLGSNLWFAGHAGFEVWYDTGSADFPFRRMQGITIERGVATPKGIAIGDQSLFWVTGDGIVLRTVGFRAQRISTHAIEQIIRGLGTSTIASALTYSQHGHIFYVVSWTTPYPRTLVYDCASEKWHDRATSEDGVGRWRPECSTINTGAPILGDSLSGKLFLANPTISTEDGMAVLRRVQLPPLWAGTRRAFCHRLEVELETGENGWPLLEWSDDGARTWTGSRTLGVGNGTHLRQRSVATRLGSFRERTFRLTTQRRTTLYAVDADIEGGAS